MRNPITARNRGIPKPSPTAIPTLFPLGDDFSSGKTAVELLDEACPLDRGADQAVFNAGPVGVVGMYETVCE